VRTKIRHLLALGTGKRLSKTLATQTGMTNMWLESQGLVSVRQLWIKAHGYS
jgi:RNA-directed DNA polymerase